MKRTALPLGLLGSGLAASVFLTGVIAAAPPSGKPQPARPSVAKPAPTIAPRPVPTIVPTLAPTSTPVVPDLVITYFRLTSWGSCAPGQTVFTFAIGVKNLGATWPSGTPLAAVVWDRHLGPPDPWGTAVAISPPLARGETRDIQFAIPYYAANPGHMVSDQPHPFQAIVNPNQHLKESDFTNNEGNGPGSWNGLNGLIMVGAPQAGSLSLDLTPREPRPGSPTLLPAP
jgi:hypothetical protein